MAEQVVEFARRLRVSRSLSGRASEYCRLAELKCPGGSISSSCMALVCIELAAAQLGEAIDKKQVQKLSGLQQRAYLSAYRTVEKVLDLCTRLGIKELAVRLGCLEGVELAEEILRGHRERLERKYSAVQREGMDLEKPVYSAAALYCSCKVLKMQVDKAKFLNSSASNRSLFQNILEDMIKCVPKDAEQYKKGRKRPLPDESESSSSKGAKRAKVSGSAVKRRESLSSRILSDPTSESYKEWRKRTIQQAKQELRRSQHTSRHTNTATHTHSAASNFVNCTLLVKDLQK